MKKEKISKRKIQAAETKNKIFETAKQLFKKNGFENVSVDSIVEEAGVSKGAFYVHFESKDVLAAILINDYVNEVDLDYKFFLDTIHTETPVSDILLSLVEKIADVITYTIGCDNIKVLYKAHLTKTINTDSAMNYNRDLYKLFSDVLSKGIQQEIFSPEMSVDMLTKHCILAIRGLTYEWCIRYPNFDLKAQCLQHFEILLNGIKKHCP